MTAPPLRAPEPRATGKILPFPASLSEEATNAYKRRDANTGERVLVLVVITVIVLVLYASAAFV